MNYELKNLKNSSEEKANMKSGGKWIQKIKTLKAHKGYCTPMTKSTCTPKRAALARTFKKMAKSRKGKEGMYMAQGAYKDNKNTPAMSHPFKSSGLKLKQSFLKTGGMTPKTKLKYGTK
jgi:hypothetical protein